MNLSDFDSLEEAKAYEVLEPRMISPDMVISLLTEYDSALTLNGASTVDNAASGFLLALSGSVGLFNVIKGTVIGDAQIELLARLVTISAVTQEFSDAVISYANDYKVKPFSEATQLQFNIAKKIYSEVKVEGYTLGASIRITLIDDLPYDCALTSWSKDGDYDYENLGRLIHLKQAQSVYKLKVSSVDGDLYLRIPIGGFSYTAELI